MGRYLGSPLRLCLGAALRLCPSLHLLILVLIILQRKRFALSMLAISDWALAKLLRQEMAISHCR